MKEIGTVEQVSLAVDCIAEIRRTGSCERFRDQLEELDRLAQAHESKELTDEAFIEECRGSYGELLARVGELCSAVVMCYINNRPLRQLMKFAREQESLL